MEMLKSKGVTHIVNLAGGDLSLGAPHIDTSVYEGAGINFVSIPMSDFQDVDDDGTQIELFKKAADLVEGYYKSNVKVFYVVPSCEETSF